MHNSSDFLVSICVITYNQERFIIESLNGIFNQKFNFSCELVIFDDCSTDSTYLLIEEYLIGKNNKFKNITLKSNSENRGISKNFYSALFNCTGKYIAICEGDDYWIDSYKLQKQVEFLENNEKFVICYHPVRILSDTIYKDDFYIEKNISAISSYNDFLIYGNYMQTCSVVFKNLISSLPIERILFINDYILWFWLSRYGEIYRINTVMGVYRLGSGIWSVLSVSKKTLHTLNSLIELRKIVRNQSDLIIIDNRINSLKFSLLPNELKSLNYNNDNVSQYLSKNIKIKGLIYSIYLKTIRFIFN